MYMFCYFQSTTWKGTATNAILQILRIHCDRLTAPWDHALNEASITLTLKLPALIILIKLKSECAKRNQKAIEPTQTGGDGRSEDVGKAHASAVQFCPWWEISWSKSTAFILSERNKYAMRSPRSRPVLWDELMFGYGLTVADSTSFLQVQPGNSDLTRPDCNKSGAMTAAPAPERQALQAEGQRRPAVATHHRHHFKTKIPL